MDDSSLKKLGFSDKEVIVYLALLRHGKILPAQLAKITGLNRSTVYSVAGELTKRGVVAEDLAGPTRYLVALPVEELMQLAMHEERELQKKKKLITETIDELRNVATQAVYAPPKISFVTQEEIEPFLRKRTPEWNRSIMERDGTWLGFQDHTFVDTYSEWIHWFWTQAPSKLHVTILSNRSETERDMKAFKYKEREILYWKNAGQFTATVWVCGDYLVMTSTSNKPHYLVEIHDVVLAQNMREVFKGILQTVKK